MIPQARGWKTKVKHGFTPAVRYAIFLPFKVNTYKPFHLRKPNGFKIGGWDSEVQVALNRKKNYREYSIEAGSIPASPTHTYKPCKARCVFSE